MGRRQAMLLAYGLAALIVVVDQAPKAVVMATLGRGQPPVVVIIPGVLELVFRLNTGMAFSLLENASLVLTVVAAAASVALAVVNARLRSKEVLPRLALGLLLGGALGNLIDRVRSSRGVVDFLDFGVGHVRWPVFNVADIAVTIGALLLAVSLWREEQKIERELDGTAG